MTTSQEAGMLIFRIAGDVHRVADEMLTHVPVQPDDEQLLVAGDVEAFLRGM